MKNRIPTVLIVAACFIATGQAQGGITEKAISIQKEKQDAVIWVEGVLKLQISSQGQTQNREQKVETLGTVIGASGLTVVPSSALNPTGMLTQMMRGSGMSMDGQLSDVKLRMADGSEVEADVVLKDDDLDIAFLSPSTSEGLPKFAYVDISKDVAPELLDQIVMIGRMPKFMNREPSVQLGRIISIVDKPRTFYCIDNLSSMGIPAYSQDGELIGISVLKKPRKLDFSAGQNAGMTPVILPAEDIRDIASQALAEIEREANED